MNPRLQSAPIPLAQAALLGALVGGGFSLVSLWSEGGGGDVVEIAGRTAGGAIGFALMFVVLAVALNWRRSRSPR